MADPRIRAFLDANAKWAKGAGYQPPIPFLEMQRRGRARADGTVIIGEAFFSVLRLGLGGCDEGLWGRMRGWWGGGLVCG
jgi:hypothetical protein